LSRCLAPQVLLIDDNPKQLHLRETVLRDAGFAVTCASSAEQALGLLRSPAPRSSVDIIITDHVLLGDTGSGLVCSLRRLNPDVPVIVISGMPEAEEQYLGLKVTFLRKPCPPESLIHHVSVCLREAIP